MLTVTFYVDGKVYDTREVEYGSVLSSVMQEAQTLNLSVRSVSYENGETPATFNESSAVTCNLNVDAVQNEQGTTALTVVSVMAGVIGLALICFGVIKVVQLIKRRNA